MSRPSNNHQSNPIPNQQTHMLSDLVADLQWPKLLKAPSMALAPTRIITGTLAVYLLTLTFKIIYSFAPTQQPDQAQSGPRSEFFSQLDSFSTRLNLLSESFVDSIFSLDPISLSHDIWLTVVTLRDLIMQSPLISLLVCFPLISIIAIAGASISRSTSIEFAQSRFANRSETIGFAFRKANHFIGAMIAPIAIAGLMFLIIAIGGLLLSAPIIDILGAILYIFALALGLFATLILCIHVIASPLIIPALAIENTDGFDAIQRSYAYVIGKPLRYLSYFTILLFLGVISASIFKLVTIGSISMTDWAAQLLANPSTAQALEGDSEMGATKDLAFTLIKSWKAIIEMIASGYIISLFFSSASLLYLLTRRVCDGQDITEICDPQSA